MKLEYVGGLPATEMRYGEASIRIEGELDPVLLGGADETFARLDKTCGAEFIRALDGLRIAILQEGVEGGGQADTEQRYIQMNYVNNLLSLSQEEELLVGRGYFEPGDRTRLDPPQDAPGSVFPVELVHEIGHIVGGELATSLSPTFYGRRAPHEAFAEAFLYFVYGVPQAIEAEQAVRAAITSISQHS